MMILSRKKLFTIISSLLMVISMSLLWGCGNATVEKNGTKQHKGIIEDSLGRKIELKLPIKSSVVACSHDIELISSVGNSLDRVIGVDAPTFKDKVAYGNRWKENQLIGQNQRNLNYEKIVELKPDVVILPHNGSWQEAEKQLAPFDIKVVVINAYYTGEFRKNCEMIGKLYGQEKEAEEFVSFFEKQLAYVKQQLKNVPKRKVYFEYRSENLSVTPGRPYYKMVEYSGVKNIFDDAANPRIDGEEILRRNPDYVIKASEANVFATYLPPSLEEFKLRKKRLLKRAGWEDLNAVKKDNILLLSHYAFGGAAEITGSLYMAKFVYPEYLPDLHPEQVMKTWVEKYQHQKYVEGHTYPRFKLED